MTRIFLVTAGQTNWDAEERIQGSLSVPLNAHGVVQVARLAAEKSDVKLDVIYTGASQDAVQTGGILAKAWGTRTEKWEGLNEVNLGLWQGILRTEAARRFGKAYKRWQREPLSVAPPGGETLDAAHLRIAGELRRILKKHREGSIGVVCGPLAAALAKCYLKDGDIGKALEMCAEPAHCEVMECR